MKKHALFALALIGAAPAPKPASAPIPSPGEIVAAALARDLSAIAPSDLLVMELAPGAFGKPRRVVIQLMPPPFSQGWIGNIRKLAAAHWWDGTSVNRVQDNYVVQWGDASEKKALPAGLVTVGEEKYTVSIMELAAAAAESAVRNLTSTIPVRSSKQVAASIGKQPNIGDIVVTSDARTQSTFYRDAYGDAGFSFGWPVAGNVRTKDFRNDRRWPIHCYGMVGVGRNLSPDTGSGAELYTVIGHAPRHLDRNIALVGRVIEGIEHLSSLPRGTGALGFYETAEERVPILSVRLGTEIKDLRAFQYLSTESNSFAKYAEARANRRDPFFIKPAGGADICNIPVPVRRVP
jgi:cyclophilin family peptidyl-prolyl cis-trans isomerase